MHLAVTGGRGGITAHMDDMVVVAGLMERICTDVLEIAAGAQRLLADPDLAASAAIDPAGARDFEAALLATLDGPHGLFVAAAALEAQAAGLRAAALAYETADRLTADMADSLGWLLGMSAPAWAPVAVPMAVPNVAAFLGTEAALGRSPAADLQRLLTEHPGTVHAVAGAVPGFLDRLLLTPPGLLGAGLFTATTGRVPFPLTLAQTAALLSLMFPDGKPTVTDLGTDANLNSPPRGFKDLADGLDRRSFEAGRTNRGEIDVRLVERIRADGTVSRAYIVDIPGTRDWSLTPGQRNADINDISTNLEATAGNRSSYERGIALALQRAGARPGDPVMLIGHSQGGMVAARAASDFATAGTYNVTHVITVGAPAADMPVPAHVQVLSLENANDLVPHLDPHANPDLPNRTTVTFATEHDGVLNNHSINKVYAPAARALDSSKDPSITAFRDSAAPFLDGDRVTTHVYQVSRAFA
jgi:hypothetical protein